MIEAKADMFEVAKAMRACGPVAIGHGCNMHGVMGAGVARIVKDRFPVAYERYSGACSAGDYKLGQNQYVNIETGLWVVNMFTQDRPGPDARMTAVELCVGQALADLPMPLVIPIIGGGIGGLDPDDVLDLLGKFPNRLVVCYL